MPEKLSREKLLLHMYDQMFNDINRHIVVVWQSVGVLVGAFAIFTLIEKQVISFDIACSLIILIAGWSLAHHLDASYWYNRNLAIIANIEKQFLTSSDLKDIHYYFGSHRPNKMIAHLRIQVLLAVGIAAIILLYHFYERVWSGFNQPLSAFDPLRLLPYIASCVIGIILLRLISLRNRTYKEFIRNSPGLSINTSGIVYGEGHGFAQTEEDEASS